MQDMGRRGAGRRASQLRHRIVQRVGTVRRTPTPKGSERCLQQQGASPRWRRYGCRRE